MSPKQKGETVGPRPYLQRLEHSLLLEVGRGSPHIARGFKLSQAKTKQSLPRILETKGLMHTCPEVCTSRIFSLQQRTQGLLAPSSSSEP